MFRIRESGEVLSPHEFERLARQRASFDTLNSDIVEALGADPVFEGPQASTEHPWQFSMKGQIEKIKDKWFQTHVVGPVFANPEDEQAYIEKFNSDRKIQLSKQVNTERERRKILGNTFDGVYMTGDAENVSNFTNIVILAQTYLNVGDLVSTITWRDGHNTMHNLTAQQVISIWVQSLKFVDSIYRCSWYLKDGVETPNDYADDKYWVLTYWEPTGSEE